MSDETISEIKIGDKFPNLPEQYFIDRENKPPGIACLIVDDGAAPGLVAFVKDGNLVAVRTIQGALINKVSDDAFDAIVMHPDDVPQEAVDKAVAKAEQIIEQAKKRYN